MGLFSKKEKKEEKKEQYLKLPELPRLPELPSLEQSSFSKTNTPTISSATKESLPQLPSFPNNSFGEKFSQNSIKEAVAGKKEVEPEVDADDFKLPGLPEANMMHEPLRPMRTREVDEYKDEQYVRHEFREPKATPAKVEYSTPKREEYIPSKREEYVPAKRISYTPSKREEPVFIRIDKFEESLKLFEETKIQIDEIEKMIKETKELKDKEEEELIHWEENIQSIKQQVEKVDKDLFSKIE
jgi:hypothetical protein